MNLKEKNANMHGFYETQTTLEKLSEIKSQVDESKEKTLEQVSDIVKRIVETIQSKKDVLAPLVNQVRQLRTKVQQKEGECEQKKILFSNAISDIEKQVDLSRQEKKGYEQAIRDSTSRYFYLQSMVQNFNISQEKSQSRLILY